MSECAHCRARDGDPHEHTCAIAKKVGLAMKAPPKLPLYVGAVVQYAVDGDRVELADPDALWLAAICTSVATVADPVTFLRVMRPDEIKDALIGNPADHAWRWPIP